MDMMKNLKIWWELNTPRVSWMDDDDDDGEKAGAHILCLGTELTGTNSFFLKKNVLVQHLADILVEPNPIPEYI